MQTVLDTPMLADRTSQALGASRQAADEVAHLMRRLVGGMIDAVANYHDDARQPYPCPCGDYLLGRWRHISFTRLRSTMTLLDLPMTAHLSIRFVGFHLCQEVVRHLCMQHGLIVFQRQHIVGVLGDDGGGDFLL